MSKRKLSEEEKKMIHELESAVLLGRTSLSGEVEDTRSVHRMTAFASISVVARRVVPTLNVSLEEPASIVVG